MKSQNLLHSFTHNSQIKCGSQSAYLGFKGFQKSDTGLEPRIRSGIREGVMEMWSEMRHLLREWWGRGWRRDTYGCGSCKIYIWWMIFLKTGKARASSHASHGEVYLIASDNILKNVTSLQAYNLVMHHIRVSYRISSYNILKMLLRCKHITP